MTGKWYLQGLGIVVLASLLSWDSPRGSRIGEDGGLCALWQRFSVIFQADDGDNRGTIDPNG
jgi:hypothetical protein